MKKITTLLFLMACVAVSASATVTINVRTTTGDAPYLYTWGGADNGEWPGTQMIATQTTTTSDNLVWFTQTFDADALNLVLNDGGDPAIQSQDFKGVTGTAYYIFDPEEGECEDVTSTYVAVQEFDPSTLPEDVVFVEGKEFAYFVAPTSWTVCYCWAWNNTTKSNFTGGTWPGAACNLIGITTDGNPVYQWVGSDIVENDRPEFIIFNNGNGKPQTADLDYVAGGVYNLAGKLLYTVPAGGSEPIPGDVNGDGYCNAADVTALYNWILSGDDKDLKNGNQDDDPAINAADVTAVYNIILGMN